MKKIGIIFVACFAFSDCKCQSNSESANWANTRAKVNKGKVAISLYTEAILLDSSFSNAYFGRAHEYFYLKDYTSAINDYSYAIRLNDLYSDAYFGRANAKYKIEDYVGAIYDYSRFIAIEKKNNNHMLGVCYEKRGDVKIIMMDYRGALRDYDDAIEIFSTPKTYLKRGISKYLLDDFAGAIDDFSHTIKIADIDAEAYYYRGLSEIALGQMENGCFDLSKAGELGFAEAYNIIRTKCNQ